MRALTYSAIKEFIRKESNVNIDYSRTVCEHFKAFDCDVYLIFQQNNQTKQFIVDIEHRGKLYSLKFSGPFKAEDIRKITYLVMKKIKQNKRSVKRNR